ncbi:hypothetical protein JKF63_05616 [Porcisia hertigi]|uniref:Uncharacterized protein n=1 Tax=Porcisia hertigi TaxID=2761500 RepID=A0A836IE22_9TRYP|nr:hypothetical protein JKF63_05616 [Porcisia hertigi]
MSSDRDNPRTGPAALDAHGIPGSFSRAREFALTREQPMLALKAYSAWMRGESVSAPARAAALLDLTLYCNIFALQRLEAGNGRVPAQLALARDYFQVVFDEFNALYGVVLPDLSAPDTDADLSTSLSDGNTDSVPDGLRVALLITIGNLACVELHVGGEGLAKAERLFLFSKELEAQMSGVPTLEWPWGIVRELNAAVSAVMHCNFIQGEEAARSAIGFLELKMDYEPADAESHASAGEVQCDENTSLLLALGYYTLGVTTESTSCDLSLLDYEQAIALVSRDNTTSSLAALMSQTRDHLAAYVEEERAKARLAAEEALRAASIGRKARRSLQSKTGKAPPSRRGLQKVTSTGLFPSESGLPVIVTPSIPDVLRDYLGREGLNTVLIRVGALAGLYEVLVRSLPGYEDSEELPQSLFAGTPLKAGAHESIFATLVCTETPLQWTLRLLKAAERPETLTHSVWNPPTVLASLLTEMAAERPPAPRSTAALQTRKEIADGNGKLRQQVIQLFSPPPNPPEVKQKAHESVGAVVALLGQRLGFLLKTERAFEEHWVATECIKSALRAFAVPQDILRLKQTLLTQRRLQELRRERSAHLILYFFRHIVKEKALREAEMLANQRRFEQREAAAVCLQKYIRRWCAYQEVRRHYAAQREYIEKVVVVQSLARRRAAARVYAEVRELRCKEEFTQAQLVLFSWAALEVQRVYRGHCARLRCCHLRGQVHHATLLHMRDSRNYYAAVIQKHVRGMLVRLQYGRAVYASRCYGRNVFKTRLWERSCVIIQRAYRAYLSRRWILDHRGVPQISTGPSLSRPGTGSSRLVFSLFTVGGRRADERRAAAAHSIQQMYRSCVARRRLEALKYARMKEAESRKAPLQWCAKSTFSLKDCVF